MVRKYIFGEPIETDAVVKEIASSAWSDGVFLKKEDGFHYILKPDEIVYGLGENVRGINKREDGVTSAIAAIIRITVRIPIPCMEHTTSLWWVTECMKPMACLWIRRAG